jgi:hypothetical protein
MIVRGGFITEDFVSCRPREGSKVGPENRRIAVGITLFLIPLLGVAITVSAVDLIVPRGRSAEFVQKIEGPFVFGADVGAAFYYLALATALLVILCAFCLWYCIQWLAKTYYSDLSAKQRMWTLAGLITALLLPLAILVAQLEFAPGCDRIGIDDCVTKALLDATIRRPKLDYHAFFAMNNDVNFVTSIGFVTYLIAALTTTVAASALPPGTNLAPASPPSNAADAADRMSLINTILFLTSAVLVSALVMAKFRFDVGLAPWFRTVQPSPARRSMRIRRFHQPSRLIGPPFCRSGLPSCTCPTRQF